MKALDVSQGKGHNQVFRIKESCYCFHGVSRPQLSSLEWSRPDQITLLYPTFTKRKKGSWWPNDLSHSSGLSLLECLVSPSIQDTLINIVPGRFCLDFDNLAPMPFSYMYECLKKKCLLSCSVALTQSNAAFYTPTPTPVRFKVILRDRPSLGIALHR